MLEVSGGFILKCDRCGAEEEYVAEVLNLARTAILEEKPLGAYVEYDFRAGFRCRCGKEHSILLRAYEYPRDLYLEGSESMVTQGCTCLESPDIEDQRTFG